MGWRRSKGNDKGKSYLNKPALLKRLLKLPSLQEIYPCWYISTQGSKYKLGYFANEEEASKFAEDFGFRKPFGLEKTQKGH